MHSVRSRDFLICIFFYLYALNHDGDAHGHDDIRNDILLRDGVHGRDDGHIRIHIHDDVYVSGSYLPPFHMNIYSHVHVYLILSVILCQYYRSVLLINIFYQFLKLII